ncbi:hypothetical protein SDC9_201684 [bioreactor metagenome]|uniref:Uncharacterized protein n=1 Tax=bioreactor metagenome TaxID=1076179 RepID=A0A645IRM0_9ZZZZ
MYLTSLIQSIFNKRYAKQDICVFQEIGTHLFNVLSHPREPILVVNNFCTLLLTQSDHRHFHQTALVLTAETGMWFHAVDENYAICPMGNLVHSDGSAIC